ncbi:kelch repeat-containing protein [Edaphobacter bradus]|uniref:kelch repeat-containing protein n=1 Tax=Edaphobacter bradus TaxID=2259016 RepID=UPI0021E079CC|nr:kelch repeat-containing protein [Edaphobacter bradus]
MDLDGRLQPVQPAGNLRTLGTPAPGNIPGARISAVSWIDKAGIFWLFGGLGIDGSGRSEYLNDLWRYSKGQWTWMGGPRISLQSTPGIYGTQGTPDPANLPGARANAASWTDPSGVFWLFGGYGADSTGALGDLNDLWNYSAGQWTWVSGSNLADQPGVYGTQGVPAPGNVPSGRYEASGWVDTSGALWLFGGTDGKTGRNGSPATFTLHNDLWKFSNGQWAWMAGSSATDQAGVYGTQGVASAANTPGARVAAATWTTSDGALWLFGGNARDATRNIGFLNDLWKFSNGQWTWVNGSNLRDAPGNYGTQGVAATGNTPGGRIGEAVWVDSSGTPFIFGGDGIITGTSVVYLNDLWQYQP